MQQEIAGEKLSEVEQLSELHVRDLAVLVSETEMPLLLDDHGIHAIEREQLV